MAKKTCNNKGVAIYMVIASLFVALILAAIVLNTILNQVSVSSHQTSRIQAYYASLAGVNLAMEKIRLQDPNWPVPAVNSEYYRLICRDTTCAGFNAGAGDVQDFRFPPAIMQVRIRVGGTDPSGGTGPFGSLRIGATTTYLHP